MRSIGRRRGGEPDDVDDLVRELGQPPRLLRGAGNMLPQALVTGTLDLTCGKVDRKGESRQRRTQLVTRDSQKLLLEVSEAAVGDVANDDDAPLLHPIDQQWLTRSLIPAPGPFSFAEGKEHREGLAIGSPALWPVRFGKGIGPTRLPGRTSATGQKTGQTRHWSAPECHPEPRP